MNQNSKSYRDFLFYVRLAENGFWFCGKPESEVLNKVVVGAESDLGAAEAFSAISSTGKSILVKPDDLNHLKNALRAKASINLHIKMWAEMLKNQILTIEELRMDYPWFEPWIWKAIERSTKTL